MGGASREKLLHVSEAVSVLVDPDAPPVSVDGRGAVVEILPHVNAAVTANVDTPTAESAVSVKGGAPSVGREQYRA